MVKHIVAWDFKEELTAEERKDAAQEIKNGLEALPKLIPELKTAKVSVNKCESSMRDLMLETTHDNYEDLLVYRDHEEHKKVQKIVHKYTTNRLCLDFEQ